MGTTSHRPFAPTPDPRFVYRDGSYSQVLADVTEGLRRREELILVTGSAGTGKSMLCNDVLLLSKLDRSVFPSLVSDPWLSTEELVGHILNDCGMPRTTGVTRHELIATLKRFLTSLSSQNAHVLLIVDEAQHLRSEVVEQLRLLSGGDNAGRQALQILLVGQPELEKLFESPHLDQRVARRCALKSFDGDEAKQYIEHRLRTANTGASRSATASLVPFRGALQAANTDRFTPSAVREIVALSSGAVRSIDMLCDRTLELASQRNIQKVDRALVREVARQMKMPVRPIRFPHASSAMVATALVAGIPPIAWYWANQPPPHQIQAKPAVESTVADPFDVSALRVVPAVSVAVASFTSQARAVDVATKLSESGLPAMARPDFAGGANLVIVGPFATDEEARAAQASANAQGFAAASILHQQTLSPGALDAVSDDRLPKLEAITPGGKRASVVIELVGAPDRVTTQRVDASAVEVQIGPISGSIHQQDVTANGGAPLIDRISLRSGTAPAGGRLVRVRVNMTEPALSRVRMVGRRVYLDLWAADPDAQMPDAQDTTTASQPRQMPSQPPQAQSQTQAGDDQYRQSVAAAVARFDEIQPFLLSAAATPSPEVLGAVGGTLSELRGVVDRIKPPKSAAQDYAILTSGMAAALAAVQPGFSGDRMSKAHEAVASMQSVKAEALAR